MSNDPKDRWDKAKIILEATGGLLTAVAIVFIGYFTNDHLNRLQESAARERLYSELMSRREESENALRKDMFASIINSFLSRDSARSTLAELESKVLNLELLSYNFHESLNLTPLFQHLDRRIAATSLAPQNRQAFLARLKNLSFEINRREADMLESAGASAEWHINLDSLLRAPLGFQLAEVTLTIDSLTRRFQVTVLKADSVRKQVQVRLQIRGPEHPPERPDSAGATFWVGFFDFPMINNTRLSHDQRCAVVLDLFDGHLAVIRALYFPGSRASLRDRSYYEDIVEHLLQKRATR